MFVQMPPGGFGFVSLNLARERTDHGDIFLKGIKAGLEGGRGENWRARPRRERVAVPPRSRDM